MKAYRLESQVGYIHAQSSTIDTLLSDPIPEDVMLFRNRIAHLVTQDSDGLYFVDYLGRDPISGSFYIGDEILNIYGQAVDDIHDLGTSNPRVTDKLIWLREYVGMSMTRMIDRDLYPSANRDQKCPPIWAEISTRLSRTGVL